MNNLTGDPAVTVTDSRQECVSCRQQIPLDGIWREWDSAFLPSPHRCLCLTCYEQWKTERRTGIAAEAERIANGIGGDVTEAPADPKAEDRDEWQQC